MKTPRRRGGPARRRAPGRGRGSGPVYSHTGQGRAGDLLVGDRAFCSYVHLAMLHARSVFGLFRVQQRQQVDFRRGRKHGGKGKPKSRFIRKLGSYDQLVEWVKPKQKPKWMSKRCRRAWWCASSAITWRPPSGGSASSTLSAGWPPPTRVTQLIVLAVIPLRPDRDEPRVKKYLKYRYRPMTRPRHILKKRPYLYADKVK